MTCNNYGSECRKFGRRAAGAGSAARCFTDARDYSLGGVYLALENGELVLRRPAGSRWNERAGRMFSFEMSQSDSRAGI